MGATYGTEIGVKSRCGIDIEDATQDFQISQALTYADGFIDAEFAQASQTVPAPTTPQAIIDASEDLATYWMLRNTSPEQAGRYLESGASLIARYILGEYFKGVVERSTEM